LTRHTQKRKIYDLQEIGMETISARKARARLYDLIDQTASSHAPVTITGKRNKAVLVSAEDWAAIHETLFLLSVPGMRETIRNGLASPLDECSHELKW
jgi:antitoxin YefM